MTAKKKGDNYSLFDLPEIDLELEDLELPEMDFDGIPELNLDDFPGLEDMDFSTSAFDDLQLDLSDFDFPKMDFDFPEVDFDITPDTRDNNERG